MQRNFNTFEIPSDIRPELVSVDNQGVTLKWPDHNDNTSLYPWSFLKRHTAKPYRLEVSPSHWGADLSPPKVRYREVMDSDKVLGRMTKLLRRYGVVVVEHTPYDEASKTQELLERIAFIRETHYGGFYDFIPDLAMADTAYTNLALPAHTDTTYFSDPAGLQAFHMLSHEPGPSGEPVSGGKSLLVDGFSAAKILAKEDARSFEILSQVNLPFHASGNKGITIAPYRRFPVLEKTGSGSVVRVRWNNDDRGVVPYSKYDVTEWYKAAKKFDEILRRKEVEHWIQLEPGMVLIFDNWRVLHGRSAFTGVRRICGGYINRDDFISRYRNLNFSKEEIRAMVVG